MTERRPHLTCTALNLRLQSSLRNYDWLLQSNSLSTLNSQHLQILKAIKTVSKLTFKEFLVHLNTNIKVVDQIF